MKNILWIILCFYCNTQNELEIGEKINNGMKIIDYPKYIMNSSGSIEKGYGILHNHCKFDVIAAADMKIKAIFTNDRRFSTSDSIKIGMLYRDIKDKLDTDNPYRQTGWASYFISKSGWKIAFNYNSLVSDTSRVKFIFKSNSPPR